MLRQSRPIDAPRRWRIPIWIWPLLVFGFAVWKMIPENPPDMPERLAAEAKAASGSYEAPAAPALAAPATATAPASTSDELRAGAGCSAGRVWVDNQMPEIWEQTRIEVNGTWEYSPGAVIPGKQPYMAQLFTRSDGTRLNLNAVTCRTIDIHATINGKRAHWNGAYR